MKGIVLFQWFFNWLGVLLCSLGACKLYSAATSFQYLSPLLSTPLIGSLEHFNQELANRSVSRIYLVKMLLGHRRSWTNRATLISSRITASTTLEESHGSNWWCLAASLCLLTQALVRTLIASLYEWVLWVAAAGLTTKTTEYVWILRVEIGRKLCWWIVHWVLGCREMILLTRWILWITTCDCSVQ